VKRILVLARTSKKQELDARNCTKTGSVWVKMAVFWLKNGQNQRLMFTVEKHK
jgi:hypothetical protein